MRPNNEIIPLSGRLGKSYFGGGFYYGKKQSEKEAGRKICYADIFRHRRRKAEI